MTKSSHLGIGRDIYKRAIASREEKNGNELAKRRRTEGDFHAMKWNKDTKKKFLRILLLLAGIAIIFAGLVLYFSGQIREKTQFGPPIVLQDPGTFNRATVERAAMTDLVVRELRTATQEAVPHTATAVSAATHAAQIGNELKCLAELDCARQMLEAGMREGAADFADVPRE